MHKKIITGIVLALSIIFVFTVCFAADGNSNVVNDVRNVMGGAENAMNNAAKGVGNAAKDAGNAVKGAASDAGKTVENSANKAGNSIQNGVNNLENGMSEKNDNNDDNNNNNNNDNNNVANNDNRNYTATRTSADTTIMGMNSTAWTWIVIGIAAIGIIAIVWYYTSQVNSQNNRDDE